MAQEVQSTTDTRSERGVVSSSTDAGRLRGGGPTNGDGGESAGLPAGTDGGDEANGGVPKAEPLKAAEKRVRRGHKYHPTRTGSTLCWRAATESS